MSDLLTCPFCGGEAQVMKMDLDSIDEGWKVWGVWCVNDLHAKDYYNHGHYIDNYPTEAEAIAAWNSRAERTCKQEERGWGTEGDHARVWLTCGHDCMVPTVQDLPNYCPNCGAKIIGG